MKRNLTPPTYNKEDLIDFRRPHAWMHAVEKHDNYKGSTGLLIACFATIAIGALIIAFKNL